MSNFNKSHHPFFNIRSKFFNQIYSHFQHSVLNSDLNSNLNISMPFSNEYYHRTKEPLNLDQSISKHTSLSIILTVLPISLIIIVIIIGNCLVIVAVLYDKRLKNQLQYWLIVSLAVADLLVGLLIMPVTLSYELLDYWALGEEMCEIWLASDVLFVTASILNLSAISLDRYWSLTDPVYYGTRRTPKRTLLMISCVWVASFLICCPLVIGWRPMTPRVPYQCLLSHDLGYVLYSSCGSFFIPVVTLLFVYARIYRITRQRAKRNLSVKRKLEISREETTTVRQNSIRIEPTPAGLLGAAAVNVVSVELPLAGPSHLEEKTGRKQFAIEDTITTNVGPCQCDSSFSLKSAIVQRQLGYRRKIMKRRERQATSLLGMIVLAFVICWMPFFSIYLLQAICCQPPDILFDIIFWLGYCNSAINPFIYNFVNPDVRKAFIKILVPRKRRRIV